MIVFLLELRHHFWFYNDNIIYNIKLKYFENILSISFISQSYEKSNSDISCLIFSVSNNIYSEFIFLIDIL